MEVEGQKRAFAEQLLRNDGDAFKAAFAVFGDPAQTGIALQIARTWVNDAFVVAEQARLLATSEAKTFLPSKEQQARDIYTLAMNEKNAPEERLKAHRLYAEIMGHIEKERAAGLTLVNQGVMLVRDAGTDADWQEKAVRQQRTLTANATVN